MASGDSGDPATTGTGAETLIDEPTQTETYVLAGGALAAGVMTLLFDSHSVATVLLLVVALLPWALVAGAVQLPTWLFVAWTVIPAALVVATVEAGGPVFLGILVVTRVFSVSSSWRLRAMAVLAAVSLPIVLFVAEAAEETEPLTPVDVGAHYFITGAGVCACSGFLLRRQRVLAAQLRWSREQLDAAAAAEERRRIAREVHDVVAHSLTVVLLNVSGARKALATQPERAAGALDRAESVGRESLDGIRRVVGLLRESDEPGSDTAPPQPTAAELPTLVEQQRDAGADVSLDVVGDLASLDRLAGAAVVRMAQEALTNAQRHAPGAPIRMKLCRDANRVVVTIRNGPTHNASLDAPGRRRGLGLVGMRERVEGLGGKFAAGRDGDDWVVTGEIPLLAASTTSLVPPEVAAGQVPGRITRSAS